MPLKVQNKILIEHLQACKKQEEKNWNPSATKYVTQTDVQFKRLWDLYEQKLQEESQSTIPAKAWRDMMEDNLSFTPWVQTTTRNNDNSLEDKQSLYKLQSKIHFILNFSIE